MKIPKYIEKAIEQRAKAAERFNHYDYVISEWIDNNGICVGSYNSYLQSIVNPWENAGRLKISIMEAGD